MAGAMKKKIKVITPRMLAEMMIALYPVKRRNGSSPGFRFDFVRYPKGAYGYCINARGSGKGIRRDLAEYAALANLPYKKVLDEVVNRKIALLVVDPFNYEEDDWDGFLRVAIHEYAHHLRYQLGRAYRWNFGVNTFESTADLISDFHDRVQGKSRHRRSGPLFGRWCLWDGGYEPLSHDPLFFFMLYFLERKAEEKGYFDMHAKPLGAMDP
jgi:hypothetical protein